MNTRDVMGTTFLKYIVAAGVCVLGSASLTASEADQQKVAGANVGFAFKLLKEISKEQPGKNIFISPYSASTVLQMVCNGARGQTLSEMQRVLGTAGLTAEVVNSANRDFDKSLNGRGTNLILNAANALWCQTQRAHQAGIHCVQSAVLRRNGRHAEFRRPGCRGRHQCLGQR